jgi:hypothetical protein
MRGFRGRRNERTAAPDGAPPWENAELEAALRGMAEAPTDESWDTLRTVLARSTVLVPVGVVDGQPTDQVLEQVADDGRRRLIAFTDWDAFARWTEEPGPYVRLAAPVLANMALRGGAGVGINPADAYCGGGLEAAHLQLLVDSPVVQPAGTSFRVANTPPDVPDESVAALRDVLRDVDGVRALWLFTGAYGSDEDELFVGVEPDPIDSPPRDDAMRALAGAFGSALPEGVNAVLRPLDADLLDFVRHAAIEVPAH